MAAIPFGCGGESTGTGEATSGRGTDAPAPSTTLALEPATTMPLDPADFTDPTMIDNPWLPMVPGTQLVLEGEANRGGGLMAHRVSITITDLTKVIDGISTRVVWERDVNEGVLRETEIAFFAQDDAGNVWNLGEYPEEYESRRFQGAPSTWISGHDGAAGGIHVHGDPRMGTPAYQAGHAPSIDFLDHAQVSATGAATCAPAGCYEGVLVVDEWDPLAQPDDGHQLKHYAPGVGPVRVDPVGGIEQETLVLVEVNQLDAAALAEAHERALGLDTRAYTIVPKIWAATSPAEAAA